jgi:5-methyltetrahydrofolate--homocysteine methyltransferase
LKEVSVSDPKAHKIWNTVQEVKEEYGDTEILRPAAVYQFFKAASRGNELLIFESKNQPNPKILAQFQFPRQRKTDGLCLADYTQPLDAGSNERLDDTVAFFVVTVGRGVRQLAEFLKNRGDYLKSHIIQALALETAEAYAELLHSQIRKSWGYPDPPEMRMIERFQAKYQGKRYSFGYPACPRLDDQALLWTLLNPGEIGVQLTDGMMMDPEASVSALVFHHHAATYFSVGQQSGEPGNDDNRLG